MEDASILLAPASISRATKILLALDAAAADQVDGGGDDDMCSLFDDARFKVGKKEGHAKRKHELSAVRVCVPWPPLIRKVARAVRAPANAGCMKRMDR